ncbi:unnamed protein product [Blepharisma stoltei]|uniref:Uncharacterized protein n=1 Tax=Blepharisma stoltei TaxID=1481888 RepID=A0AAU9K5E8_9CILI|nr:unnamed protein product [Blepharisma stoltei]
MNNNEISEKFVNDWVSETKNELHLIIKDKNSYYNFDFYNEKKDDNSNGRFEWPQDCPILDSDIEKDNSANKRKQNRKISGLNFSDIARNFENFCK